MRTTKYLPRAATMTQNTWVKALDADTSRTIIRVENQDASNQLKYINTRYPWSLTFGGAAGDVDITAALTAALKAATKGTLTFWINRDSGGVGTDTIWSAGDTNADAYIELTIDNANKLTAKLKTAAAIQWAMTTTMAIETGVWTQIKLKHNGIVPALFVDGDSVAVTWGTSTDKTAWFADLTTVLDNMYLGASSYNASGVQNRFLGDMSFCMIEAGMFSDFTGAHSVVARYEFSDGTGTTLSDSTANGDDGTITSVSWADKSPGLICPADYSMTILQDEGCQDPLWLHTAAAAHGTVVVGVGRDANPTRRR